MHPILYMRDCIPLYTCNHTRPIPRIKTRIPIYICNAYTPILRMRAHIPNANAMLNKIMRYPAKLSRGQVEPYGMAALQASTSPRHNHVINECMNNYRMNAATGYKILGIQYKKIKYTSLGCAGNLVHAWLAQRR